MNTQHTPGPWHVYPDSQLNTIVDSSKDRRLALTFAGEISSHEEANANARLIAAAPDMLSALIRIEGWIARQHLPEIQGIACDIFNAIAKARKGTL